MSGGRTLGVSLECELREGAAGRKERGRKGWDETQIDLIRVAW